MAFGLTLGLLAGGRDSTRELDVPGVAVAAAARLPLLAHRRSPLGVFAVTTAASALGSALGYALGPPFGPTVSRSSSWRTTPHPLARRPTAAVVVGMFAVHIGATAISDGGFPTTPILFGVVVWGGAWGIGDGRPAAAAPGRPRRAK